MIKKLLILSLVFSGVFLLSYSNHENYLENQAINLPFSLKKIYLFHLGFSLIVCFNFYLLSTVDKIFDQLGFIYLVTLFLKIILFCIIFYQSIINQEHLSLIVRVSLLIPTFIFLLTEAFFIIQIFNSKNDK